MCLLLVGLATLAVAFLLVLAASAANRIEVLRRQSYQDALAPCRNPAGKGLSKQPMPGGKGFWR